VGPFVARSKPKSTRAAQSSRGPRPRGPVGASQSVNWVSTALPLTTCLIVWGSGEASPPHMEWLPIAHDLIGTAASAWTVLQLMLRWSILKGRWISKLSWPGLGLMSMYALLTLQPMLATASSMLHGTSATLFWIPLPSVLPENPSIALYVDRVHGINAIVLLGVIGWQVGSALGTLLRYRNAA
jgi:cytochrome b561